MEPYYDAELHNYHIAPLYNAYGELIGKVAYGQIHNDKKKRWENGHSVRTSLISKEEKVGGILYITTRNSVYKVVKK